MSIVKNGLIYLIGNLLGKGIRFLLIPIYVAHLNKEEIGEISFSQSISVFLSYLLAFGLSSSIFKFYYINVSNYDKRDFLSNIILTKSVFSILITLLFILIFCLIHYVYVQINLYLFVFSILIGFFQSYNTIINSIYVTKKEPLNFQKFSMISFILPAISIIVCIVIFNLGIKGYFFASMFSGLLIVVWIFYEFFNGWKGIKFYTSNEFKLNIRSVYIHALPSIPHKFFQWFLVLSDRFLIIYFLSAELLAEYTVGYQLAMMLGVVSVVLSNLISPSIMKKNVGKEAIDFHFKNFPLINLIFLIFIFLYIFSPNILFLFANEDYISSILIFKLILISYFIQSVFVYNSSIFNYFSRNLLITYSSGISVVVLLVLNLILIPPFGIIGCAISTLVGYIVLTFSNVIYLRRLKINYTIYLKYLYYYIFFIIILLFYDHLFFNNDFNFSFYNSIIKLFSFILFVSIFYISYKIFFRKNFISETKLILQSKNI